MPLIVKLLAQRIALGLILLLLVSGLIFVGTMILPGDVAQSILGQSATPEALFGWLNELQARGIAVESLTVDPVDGAPGTLSVGATLRGAS